MLLRRWKSKGVDKPDEGLGGTRSNGREAGGAGGGDTRIFCSPLIDSKLRRGLAAAPVSSGMGALGITRGCITGP